VAGLGRKVFASGEVLTATDLQGYAVDQSVMVFASSSARTTAISSPSEGMVTYLESTNLVEVYNGSAWVQVGGAQGLLKQYQFGYTQSVVSTSSTSYTDTGLSVTITPTSADSEILVYFSQNGVTKSTADTGVGIQLLQDGSQFIGNMGGNVGSTGTTDANNVGSLSGFQRFQPSTTSAVVYKTQFASNNGNGSVSVNSASLSTMMVLEVTA